MSGKFDRDLVDVDFDAVRIAEVMRFWLQYDAKPEGGHLCKNLVLEALLQSKTHTVCAL